MPIILPDPPPPVVTAHVLGEDRLRQRGAVLATEALADWTLLAPAGRGLALGALAGTLVTLDGLRLTPAADGQFDLSLLPLSLLADATLAAGPAGAALGAGALAGSAQFSLVPPDAGSRGLALAGGQAGQGIAGLDLRLGGGQGWLAGGYTLGGALTTPAGLAATGQGRWHLAGRLRQGIGAATLSARGLLATRSEGSDTADYHELAVTLAGGERWRWQLAAATGGHATQAASSHQALLAADLAGDTGLVLPSASQPIRLALGAEVRRLRLGSARLIARDLHATARIPLLQDRPAVESLELDLGLRQSWLAWRSEQLWHVAGRWEFFPGLALRGQVARGIDDLAITSGTARSLGLFLSPAFVPGFVASIDWRRQAAGPARIAAVDVAALWRGRLGSAAQLTIEGLATHNGERPATPLPVPRFQSLLRARVEAGGWALLAGWRHRSTLAIEPARHWLDLGVERQLSERFRLIASVGNAGNAASSSAAAVGRQALLQLVAGF